MPLKESDFLTQEEKVLSEKEKEKEKLDRIIKVAKERVEKYFEDPEDELLVCIYLPAPIHHLHQPEGFQLNKLYQLVYI
jgi:hypothetical protein